MNNEAPRTGLTHATLRNEQGSGHPAGEIRLPRESLVGRRAALLAGLANLGDDLSTITDTVSMSVV